MFQRTRIPAFAIAFIGGSVYFSRSIISKLFSLSLEFLRISFQSELLIYDVSLVRLFFITKSFLITIKLLIIIEIKKEIRIIIKPPIKYVIKILMYNPKHNPVKKNIMPITFLLGFSINKSPHFGHRINSSLKAKNPNEMDVLQVGQGFLNSLVFIVKANKGFIKSLFIQTQFSRLQCFSNITANWNIPSNINHFL